MMKEIAVDEHEHSSDSEQAAGDHERRSRKNRISQQHRHQHSKKKKTAAAAATPAAHTASSTFLVFLFGVTATGTVASLLTLMTLYRSFQATTAVTTYYPHDAEVVINATTAAVSQQQQQQQSSYERMVDAKHRRQQHQSLRHNSSHSVVDVVLNDPRDAPYTAQLLSPIRDDPWPNLIDQTAGYQSMGFIHGYRNQMMCFLMFVLDVSSTKSGCGGQGCRQILHTTLLHKDNLGTDRFVPHAELFDIKHWNSYYPRLPRMVSCDESQMTDFDCQANDWKSKANAGKIPWFHNESVTLPGLARPHAHRKNYFGDYYHYAEHQGVFTKPQFPHPVDLLLMRGAIRPHPELMQIVNRVKREQLASWTPVQTPAVGQRRQQQQEQGQVTQPPNPKRRQQLDRYMTIHARVEPDMQRHEKQRFPICVSNKVTRLRDIIDFVYATWPRGPPRNIRHVFLPINRKLLEAEGSADIQVEPHHTHHAHPNITNSTTNWVAIENLKLLTQLVAEGMWNGTVSVFEGGSSALARTRFDNISMLAGAMLDYEIAVGATVFLGTELSSWSHDLLNTRFYRDRSSVNYKYNPDGLQRWTNDNTTHPPPFKC